MGNTVWETVDYATETKWSDNNHDNPKPVPGKLEGQSMRKWGIFH